MSPEWPGPGNAADPRRGPAEPSSQPLGAPAAALAASVDDLSVSVARISGDVQVLKTVKSPVVAGAVSAVVLALGALVLVLVAHAQQDTLRDDVAGVQAAQRQTVTMHARIDAQIRALCVAVLRPREAIAPPRELLALKAQCEGAI